MQSELFDSLLSVGGLRDQLYVGFSVDQRFDSFAEQRMVVHRENPDHEFAAFLRNSPRTMRPGDVPYAIDPGMLNSISVPAPVALHTSSFPPIRLARSRIPGTPKWPARPSATIRGSMPFPSSRMRNWSKLPLYLISASILRACA